MCLVKLPRFLVFFFVIPLSLQHICRSSDLPETCSPSSCGKISNISNPFRLKSDPIHCGDPRYELACEDNITVLSLFSGKYHVQSINYNNYTVRIVDPGLEQDDCSSFPCYFLSQTNFSDTYNFSEYTARDGFREPYHAGFLRYRGTSFQHIVYLNCSNRVMVDPEYVDTAPCLNWTSKGHIYAFPGDLLVGKLKAGCHVKFAATITWNWGSVRDNKSLSYPDIHRVLLYGFEVSWLHRACQDRCPPKEYYNCYFRTDSEKLECADRVGGILLMLATIVEEYIFGIFKGLLQIAGMHVSDYSTPVIEIGVITGRYILPYLTARFLVGITILLVFLVHKWRRRHISMYDKIEIFLQDNDLGPIRYSYKEIKNMTQGFKDKLGEGGYGSVYKGKLRSGPFVAIKMLGKSKANGQDFISEVATIGRIHHANIVRLVGFCAEGSKRALVYEFMSNGSLDKYIFSKDGRNPLSYEEIHKISLGVARGVTYLHQGCDIQILHFDIKPHNILLDENIVPKVSDFGLAKLYPMNDSIVTLTAARGTIGYMAPELFYKNIGGVSYKADVYSFGMLLMEMAGRRKNLNTQAEHSSQLYFPFWIYDQFNDKKDIKMEDVTNEEKNVAKKMFIIALWCIQLKPCDRPSMNKVVEMLEREVESLKMPPKPSLYPHEKVAKECENSSEEIESNDSVGSTSNISENATDPLLKKSV